jgi:hypothetical protein
MKGRKIEFDLTQSGTDYFIFLSSIFLSFECFWGMILPQPGQAGTKKENFLVSGFSELSGLFVKSGYLFQKIFAFFAQIQL